MLYVYSLQNKKALRSISLLKNTPFRYGRERILDVTKDNRLLCLYEKPYWGGFFVFGTHFAVDMEHPQRIQMRTPTFPNKWEYKSVALSPDKTHLLWQVGLPLGSSSESVFILVSDLEMKHFEEIGTLPINMGELRWNPDGKHFSIKYKDDLWIIPLSKE